MSVVPSIAPMQPPDQGPSTHYSSRSSRLGGRPTQVETRQHLSLAQGSDYRMGDQPPLMNGVPDQQQYYGSEHGVNGEAYGNMNGSRQHPPLAGPVLATLATTAISRQNSTSSTASSGLNESSEQLLRQTLSLSANVQQYSDGRQNRRKSGHSTPSTPKPSGVLTPASTAHPSPELTSTDNVTDDIFHDFDGGIARHGFGDEYNSEAYLALLEQVRTYILG